MRILLTLCIASFCLFSSCTKTCEDTPLSELVIGTWSPSYAEDLEFTFNAGGELLDPDKAIIHVGGENENTKTWEIIDGNTLRLSASFSIPGETGSTSTDYEVTSFTCDEILLDGTVTLTRK